MKRGVCPHTCSLLKMVLIDTVIISRSLVSTCHLLGLLWFCLRCWKVVIDRALIGNLSREPSGPFSPVEHVDDYGDSGFPTGRGRSNAGLCHCDLHNDSCSLQLIAQAFRFREIMLTGSPGKRVQWNIVSAGGRKKCRCNLEVFKMNDEKNQEFNSWFGRWYLSQCLFW